MIGKLYSTIASRKKKAKALNRTKWQEKQKRETKWCRYSSLWQLVAEKPKFWHKVVIFIPPRNKKSSDGSLLFSIQKRLSLHV
ncbi:TPA: hypothetical protein NJ909_004301 [Vibrio parahaemolyticus]|uniref:hypothetical protein n=1 Tax=Vibrio parahaemolyticus TaxID=670 RepID=UPI001E424847|nr:hypothetical protein [Vibrio parahaemolyticus]HCE1959744.1 hypothetical protein [Vibrio parahaemolyticus]HCG8027235.1 hypothetical protein [Vibrio parahaemolyticus]HCG8591278.1 hypothetical protein [Vibrio parahaemolyticus]